MFLLGRWTIEVRARTDVEGWKPYKLRVTLFSVVIAQCIRHCRVIKIGFISQWAHYTNGSFPCAFFRWTTMFLRVRNGPVPSSKRMHVYSIVVNEYAIHGLDGNIGSKTCGRCNFFLWWNRRRQCTLISVLCFYEFNSLWNDYALTVSFAFGVERTEV